MEDVEELVTIDGNSETSTSDDISSSNSIIEPFSLYKELAHWIKASLKSMRKESPALKIEMPFDFLVVGCNSVVSRSVRSVDHSGTQQALTRLYTICLVPISMFVAVATIAMQF